MPTQKRVTDSFPIMAGNGDIYHIEEITEFTTVTIAAGTFEEPGKVWYQTSDSRGVNSNGDGTFTIPTLDVTGVDNRSRRS